MSLLIGLRLLQCTFSAVYARKVLQLSHPPLTGFTRGLFGDDYLSAGRDPGVWELAKGKKNLFSDPRLAADSIATMKFLPSSLPKLKTTN